MWTLIWLFTAGIMFRFGWGFGTFCTEALLDFIELIQRRWRRRNDV